MFKSIHYISTSPRIFRLIDSEFVCLVSDLDIIDEFAEVNIPHDQSGKITDADAMYWGRYLYSLHVGVAVITEYHRRKLSIARNLALCLMETDSASYIKLLNKSFLKFFSHKETKYIDFFYSDALHHNMIKEFDKLNNLK